MINIQVDKFASQRYKMVADQIVSGEIKIFWLGQAMDLMAGLNKHHFI